MENIPNKRHVISRKELIGVSNAFLADYGVSEGHVISRKGLRFV